MASHVQSAELELDRRGAQRVAQRHCSDGTSNESTLMVVGEEKSKEPLETAAAAVEKRCRMFTQVISGFRNARRWSGGLPAVEYQYGEKRTTMTGRENWCSSRAANEILTVLGMTYADSDLIQNSGKCHRARHRESRLQRP